MGGEIARALRQGLAAQIGRRRDDDPTGHADFSRDQRGIGDLAAANGKINTFLDQIGVGIIHQEVDGDVGIACQKFLQMRDHPQAAEHHRHCETQRP